MQGTMALPLCIRRDRYLDPPPRRYRRQTSLLLEMTSKAPPHAPENKTEVEKNTDLTHVDDALVLIEQRVIQI